MPLRTLPYFKEGQTGYILISLADELEAAIIPNSFTWTLNDLITKQEIASGTVSNPGAASYTFELTPAMNCIITSTEEYEEHVLTIDAIYETSRHSTGDFHFLVENLEFVQS